MRNGEVQKLCLIRVSDRLRLLDLALAGDVRLDALRPLHLGDALAALAPVRLVPAMANRMQLELLGQSKHFGLQSLPCSSWGRELVPESLVRVLHLQLLPLGEVRVERVLLWLKEIGVR